jgi:hypothetical protein
MHRLSTNRKRMLWISIGSLLLIAILIWLGNGGWPATGPTGDVFPPHIYKVFPIDGQVNSNVKSICASFQFTADKGMGIRPTDTIWFFYDGLYVGPDLDGMLTLDDPVSLGTLCFRSKNYLYLGWHTAKVIYQDTANQFFSYTWRFKIEKITTPITSTTIITTPKVVVTAWTALVNGTLIKTDGCLFLRSSDDNTAYTLVWPPDFAVTIEGDTFRVTSGIIAGSRIETIHRIGEKVTLGGGTTNQLSEALQKTVPANCAAPYWVVGSVSGKQ